MSDLYPDGFPGDFDFDREVGRDDHAELQDVPVHRRGCVDDEGKLECVCELDGRWGW